MHEPNTTSLPAHAQLVQMGTAHWASHIPYVAAQLGLADHLAKGPTSAAESAAVTKTHSPSLSRFMRTLGHLGLVMEDASGRFTLTPLGAALKSGAPDSAGAAILTSVSLDAVPPQWPADILGEVIPAALTKSPAARQLGCLVRIWRNNRHA